MQASVVPEETMSDSSYRTSFSVDRAPEAVFDAINDVRGWWMTKIDGANKAVGDEFSYRVPGVHSCTMRVTELVPGERVVWTVVANHMTFIEDQSEWIGTEIRFELSAKGGATEVRFTHEGLVPSYECFDICRNAWTFYVGDSLRKLAATGEGEPSDPDTLSLGEEAARVG
jgi:uncharacterized protein YndB with AHSA1/START domain